jgi:hypothetical protein
VKNNKPKTPKERLVFLNKTKDFKDVSQKLQKANSFKDIQLNFEGSKYYEYVYHFQDQRL